MNLDLLIKLVKLANNNPNENEANLAARKACKIIAEGNYNLALASTPHTNRVNNPGRTQWASNPNSNPYRDMWDFFYGAGPPRNSGNWTNPPKNAEPPRPNPKQSYDNETRYEHTRNRYDIPFEQRTYDEPPKKPKIRRVCTRCQLDVETSNTKEVFICGICLWADWKIEQDAK